jgi:hypothetical protein
MFKARRSRFWLLVLFRPPGRLFEQVDLDVRHRDDFLVPALNDSRAERFPCGGVERL